MPELTLKQRAEMKMMFPGVADSLAERRYRELLARLDRMDEKLALIREALGGAEQTITVLEGQGRGSKKPPAKLKSV